MGVLRARVLLAGVASVVVAAGLGAPSPSGAAVSPLLVRYPYLTDLTATSVQVTWATSNTAGDGASPGFVTWGSVGSACTGQQTAAAVSSYSAFGSTYVQHSARIGATAGATALSPATSYCYRIWTGTTAPASDLVGTDTTDPMRVTTLPAAVSTPYSFDVLGDWGETSTVPGTPSTFNVYQQHLMDQIAASTQGANPATFAVSAGDIAYADGSQTNYGDGTSPHRADVLSQPETSNIFDTRYWGKVGGSLPLFATTGNHGRNSTFLTVWPQPVSTVPAAGYPTGRYAVSPGNTYPPIDGYTQSSSTTDDWYAFTVGGVRFYILDADWTDISPSAYPTLGTGCQAQTGGSNCPSYQLERDEHWRTSSAEYQWLTADLAHDQSARGSGALRMAFFHYPLRVDQNNWPTAADVYLQNSAQNPAGAASSLEKVLADNHVRLAFNGHAHLYERNLAPVGGISSYVTGGGGGVLANVITPAKCSTTDAYARGWDMTAKVGSACGVPATGAGASAPDNVFHFLKVTVNGSDVTVTPTDSLGKTFDVLTYHFADTTPPSAPPNQPTVSLGAGTNQVSITGWGTSLDSTDGAASAYDIYRDGSYLATVAARISSYTDTAPPGTHLWTVRARDLAGNQSGDGPSSAAVTVGDTVPPTAPIVSATTGNVGGEIDLSWSGATDNVGVTSYSVLRDGQATPIATGLTSTAFADTGNAPGSSHSYTITAYDGSGNPSPPSAPATATAGTTQPPILNDGFESGSFGPPWISPATGDLTVQGTVANSGQWAAEEKSTGSPSWITAALPSTYRAVHASAWVYVKARSTSASILKLRGPNGQYIAYLYINAAGDLAIRNDAGLITHASSTLITPGRWYHTELYLDVNPGGPITLRAAVNGIPVTLTTGVQTGETLGTVPIGQLTLGDDVASRTYDMVLDDITMDTNQPAW